ncbi:outer-membrane lipoprotein carrier protein [Neokomagataea thailandica NBRC 106555]|uniref:Outer membrane lipoprotein carrier protein LolA n=2 Tax=Neokomagataea TaxID=1223423 RepID=A0A4Y6V633_9PROT|nr:MULTISPECIES: outer membrane lipoprotein carrier protein LolA [Neokomagataea]QDH23957.1 outer membrane lipoprotein carrier protein LolA [Neokomagataea tanensis]GBR54570.1 outer-membrane lipoprotein carrier protein [Neokomagataea thailandica NBRC 106555]
MLLALTGCASHGLDRLTPQQRVDAERVETYLNALHGMTASFAQNGPESMRGSGSFAYVPGHLRLDYTLPHTMRLIAGDGRLILNDSASGSETRVSLKRNPLGLLLRYPLRFAGDIDVTDVRHEGSILSLSLAEADNPSQGLLTLDFVDNGQGLNLIGLQGVDARQHRFSVALTSVTDAAVPDPALFKFPQE